MDKKIPFKPLAAALGTTFAVTLVAAPMANAADNPFAATEFVSGYMVADSQAEGKCGEGMSSEAKDEAAKAGEGKCGEAKEDEAKGGEGSCGEAKDSEGKCGS